MQLRSGTIINDNQTKTNFIIKTIKGYLAELNDATVEMFPDAIFRKMYRLTIIHKILNYLLLHHKFLDQLSRNDSSWKRLICTVIKNVVPRLLSEANEFKSINAKWTVQQNAKFNHFVQTSNKVQIAFHNCNNVAVR